MAFFLFVGWFFESGFPCSFGPILELALGDQADFEFAEILMHQWHSINVTLTLFV